MVDGVLISKHDLLTTGDDDPLLPQLVHAINNATEIEIAVSFIQPSGLDLLLPSIRDAIERQDKLNQPLSLKILTSDYLHITHPVALRGLLELEGTGVEIKIFESDNKSFHLKSYIFVRSEKETSFFQGTAFIGSNNISRAALTDAHEWCLRLDYQEPTHSYQAIQFNQVREKFARLFAHPQARSLTDEWISHYIQIRKKIPWIKLAEHNFFEEPQFVPNSAQEEALALLKNTREEGFKRGLVVLATGMGKTWLAAFDAKQMQAKRVLFVAHREEILKQALNTFAKIWPEKSSTLFDGNTKCKETAAIKDMLFASVQTIGREENLQPFAADDFDYVVIDEFHHAEAKTYRRVIEHFSPVFMLGLTATPQRSDKANILTLCDNNLVFERNLVHGIDAKILAPFHYVGIGDDTVDYKEIPWRNGKFDPKALESEFITRKRAEHVFKHWHIHKQTRTLAFCVSQKHADFMSDSFNHYFAAQGYKSASVHSQSKLIRNEALTQLEKNEIDVLFCVDLFNEGTDLPSIDTILMCRPTESSIIFLQQLGRGLRLHTNKSHLVVIDFIGNHRSFLNRPENLPGLSITGGLGGGVRINTADIPDGCEINLDLTSTNFFAVMGNNLRYTALEDYHYLYEQLGYRPSALEFYQQYGELKKVNKQHGSWWQMIATISEDNDRNRVIDRHYEFLFAAIQKTPMTKSFKMILLEAFIALGGLNQPISQKELAIKSWDSLSHYPNIKQKDLSSTVQSYQADSSKWLNYWRDNPIKASLNSKGQEQAWFIEQNNNNELLFMLNFDVLSEDVDILKDLIQELIDLRLAQYVERAKSGAR